MKYLISESKASAIAQFIKPHTRPDRHCQSNGCYPIVSLYLDSDDLMLCRESLTGKKNRFKLRIRSYTDEPNYPRFFEIKRRANTVIIKSRAKVIHSDVAPLISGMIPSSRSNGSEGKALEQFQLYHRSIGGMPIVRIQYLRQAFECIADRRARVTFDRNLRYNMTSAPDVSFNGHGWQELLLNKVILEIKFTDYYPTWIEQIIRHFDLQRKSISKYGISVMHGCQSGFNAYKL
ncbi:MAG: polyphosphate polymerase domain-containing protein [Planctomycetes bacterium]|nr:polyphosphate polymerase domain-containing protein [Planctomycetota bacterium]